MFCIRKVNSILHQHSTVACNVRIREHKLFSLHHNNFMGEKNGKGQTMSNFLILPSQREPSRRSGRELAKCSEKQLC